MYCSGCGRAAVVDQLYCPGCGRPSNFTHSSSQVGPTAAAQGFSRKIRAFAFCWLGYGALMLVLLVLMGTKFDQMDPFLESAGSKLLSLALLSLWILAWLHALVGIAAAIGLLNFQRWGKGLAIISSLLALLFLPGFPISTGIGAWGLFILLNKGNSAEYNALS